MQSVSVQTQVVHGWFYHDGRGALGRLLGLDSFLEEVFCKTVVHMLYIWQPFQLSKSLFQTPQNLSGIDCYAVRAELQLCGLTSNFASIAPGGHSHLPRAFYCT